MTRPLPRIVVSGTASGVGKTTVTAGLIAALRRRGLVVQPFKCGPDYIDPGYHTLAAGRPCRNLDSWMLNDEQVRDGFVRASRGADVAVIEGVMGLFDGADFDGERASAAQIAKLIGAPVLLVMDISGAGRSAAATALGFARFDPDLRVEAVVLNRAGSGKHATGCAQAIERMAGLRVVGFLPRDETLRVPERHLGLLPTGERAGMDQLLAAMADAVERHCDVDAVLRLAATAGPAPAISRAARIAGAAPDNAPILAVARDEAFSFYYPDNLELIEAAGARIVFFSPVHGERLPAGSAGVYLGGGFPEVYARALSANTVLWDDLRALHARGAPILAECGGFMVLTQALIDGDGERHPMAGLVPGTTRMTARLAGLGYRHAVAVRDNLLAESGETLRGHEFHYSVWDSESRDPAWRVRGTRPGAEESDFGYAKDGLLASYLHIHLAQNAALADRLVTHLRATGTSSPRQPTGQTCT
jgi:cobyrinic acid a,c-diamide synthase